MAKITALFLDIGGVLLTNGWGHASRKLAAVTFDLDLEEMESRHRATFDLYELGKIDLDTYLDRLVFYKKRSFSKEAFKKFIFSQSKPFPKMLELIKTLKKKHQLKIIVVSNEGREINAYRVKKFKLDSFVDCFISSSFVHLRKPDLDIFRAALDIAQVSAKEVLYLEDREMFIQVAKELGIQGLHHTSYETTYSKITSFFKK